MIEKILIRVFEVVGSSLCVASDDGQKVHDQIADAFKKDKNVTLSFLNVESLTSAFLNAAVGQLYAEFNEQKIKSSLEVADMEPDDLGLLKRVVDTAKEYFKNPDRAKAVRKAREELLGKYGQK